MINLRVLGKELAGDGKDAAPEFEAVGLIQRGYFLPAGGLFPPLALPRGTGAEGEVASVFLEGEERPVCREHNETCWQQNRRVNIVYTVE